MLVAERFKSFSTSQNLGFAAVENIKNSDVYNTVTNKLHEVSSELKDVVNGLIQDSGLPVDDIKNLVTDNVRAVKDVFSTLQDITKLTPAAIESQIAEMLPFDRDLQNVFRNLASTCRDPAMAGMPGFKPFNDNFSCGSPSDGRCSSGSVNNLLSKATGGLIGTVARSIQSMLRSVMTLARLGYSGGMCKIFSALINGLPNNVVQRASAGLLALVGGSGNTTAVLDIASSIGLMNGINPSREISGLVGRIAENFTIPGNYTPGQFGSLYEGMTTALDVINPGYGTTVDGLVNIAELGLSKSAAFAETASAWLSGDTNLASFDEPYSPAESGGAVGYLTDSFASASSAISDWFG